MNLFFFVFLVYFTCIVKVLYNLLYYQIVVQLCTTLTELECSELINKYEPQFQETNDDMVNNDSDVETGTKKISNLGAAIAFVLTNTNRCRHLRRECLDEVSGSKIDITVLEQQMQKLCLPFLRIASLLRHHLYLQELPDIKTPQLEYVRLIYYLELVTESMDWSEFSAAKALCFLPGTDISLPKKWCEELMEIRPPSDTIRELILNQHITWYQPRLLTLPREYERLFTVS